MGLLRDIIFRAGVIKDDTELAAAKFKNKRVWSDSDRIRFVNGLPQKLGGWSKHVSGQFLGKARGMMGWQDNSNVKRLGIGTSKKLYALEATTFVNITPLSSSGTLTNPFATTSGSATVTVTHATHGRAAGDYVEFDGASAVGGITIDGNYPVVTVTTNDYTITHGSAASSTASGGGTVSYEYEIPIGLDDAEAGTGWGVGGYGLEAYGTARTGSYILLPPRTWSVDQWGQFLVGCPRAGSIYEWQLNAGTRAQVISNAPTNNIGMFVTEEQHMVALGADGDKMLVQWCDQSDNTDWTPSDQNSSGSRNLTGGSQIYTAIRTRGTNLIFTDAAVWSMQHIGGLGVFAFDQVAAGGAGIVGSQAAVEVDGVVFWMGRNDFYLYDGVVRRIPNSKHNRRHVFDNLTDLQRDKCIAGVNSLYSEIWFIYPTSTENGVYVKVNYEDWSWDVGTISRTSMIDRDIFDNPLLAGADGYIYAHESGVDDGDSAMNEHIQSTPFDIQEGNRAVEILGMIPDFKDLTGSITLTVMTREYPAATESSEDATVITSSTEEIDVRASGRQAAIRLESSDTGTNWRWGTLRFDVHPGGAR